MEPGLLQRETVGKSGKSGENGAVRVWEIIEFLILSAVEAESSAEGS